MKQALAGLVAFLIAVAGGAITMRDGVFTSQASDGEVSGLAIAGPRAPTPIAASEAEGGVETPRWSVGFGWRIEFAHTDFTCDALVVEASPVGYRQGYVCDGAETLATQDEMFYPQLGAFTRDLGGHAGEEIVQWFSFPLVDGLSWPLSIDGEDYLATARFERDVDGPHGEEPGFEITVEYDGGSSPVYEYNYVPSIAWWSHFEAADGFEMEVIAFDPAASGTAVTASVEPLFEDEPIFGATAPVTAFFVDEEHDHLYLAGSLSGFHVQRVQLIAPNGQPRYDAGYSAFTGGTSTISGLLQAEAGAWQLRVLGATVGSTSISVSGVVIETWEV